MSLKYVKNAVVKWTLEVRIGYMGIWLVPVERRWMNAARVKPLTSSMTEPTGKYS